MDEATKKLLTDMTGEHTYDAHARAGNWVAIWVFVMLPAVVVGIAEAFLRGWDTVQATPALVGAAVCGAVWGGAWIRSFNLTRYRIASGAIECSTSWPRRSWKVWFEELESAVLEVSHRHWSLVLRQRSGGRKKVVLTRSMRVALGLP